MEQTSEVFYKNMRIKENRPPPVNMSGIPRIPEHHQKSKISEGPVVCSLRSGRFSCSHFPQAVDSAVKPPVNYTGGK